MPARSSPPRTHRSGRRRTGPTSRRSARARFAHDPATGGILPHIHVSVGLKAQSADGRTSHLLSAKVQFLSELLIVEVTSPTMTRHRDPDLYDVPLLTFG
ncbi:hypothetical protein ACFQ7I_08945 [Streptomyces massasporeus]